ncbi:restriction endonuclease subunit S [Algoriphagus aquatilis]|uniref:Restriction endonuclease subunit S n=1 Tax=Algoriphagus aquatilis TaxID=490186 RepID=A0ABW0C074_9BACT
MNQFKLSEILEIIGGGTPKTNVSEYWGGDIPWLSVVDFGNGQKRVYQTEKSISELGLKNSSTKILKAGEIIISARGTVGELAVLGKNMAFNQSCYGLTAIPTICTNEFLYYLLKQKVSELKKNAHGAVFDTITRSTFETINVDIPPLPTQKAIAEILSSLDDKIELNNQINQNLEALAQALFKQWFVDFEFPNENGHPYKSSGGEMVDSELGEIPKGWRVDFLTKVFNVVYGKNLPTTNLITNGFPVFGGNGIIGYYSKFHYKEPQVLISCRGAASGKVNFSKPFSFVTNNSLIIEIPDREKMPFEFLRQWSLDQDFTSFVSGSAQPQITIENLKPLQLLIPNQETLEKFKEVISHLIIQIQELEVENIGLQNLRDTLLPKLISGELEVNESLLEQTF